MLNGALAQFAAEPANARDDVLVVTEMSLSNLLEGDAIDNRDFLDRVDILRTLGHPVMISNFGEFYRLANFLQRQTSKLIGLAMGVPTLRELFQEKYYTDLAGGILESFGRLFKNDLKLYAYPELDPGTGRVVTASDLRVAPKLQHLYAFLVENQHIQPIHKYHEEYLSIFSRDVFRRMHEGDPMWVHEVPPGVALLICQHHLLGYDPDTFDAGGPPPGVAEGR
ncbi:MAG: hypothetical protein LC745_02165 [Planctomycetia bacterium]|nr:hypothetical protein [Planctomycetia bacterium]